MINRCGGLFCFFSFPMPFDFAFFMKIEMLWNIDFSVR